MGPGSKSAQHLKAVVEFDLQGLVGHLEGQNGSDAGQIEAIVEESADQTEADEVVVAVATSASVAAGRMDQTSGLVEAEVLWSTSHQLGGDGDSV